MDQMIELEDKDQLSRTKNVKIFLGKISQPTTYNTKRLAN